MNDYVRRDYRLEVVREGERARLRVTRPNATQWQTEVARELLDRAAQGDDADLHAQLLPERAWGRLKAAPTAELVRLCVSVTERSWAQVAWEAFAWPGAFVVRVCDVRPRVRQTSFTFPMRIFEAGGKHRVPQWLEGTFGSSERSRAVVEAWSADARPATPPKSLEWPTVDLLHLHDMTVTLANKLTILKWLQPFTERYQTRLIVFECQKAYLPLARELAQTMVERSGPAIWAIDSAFLDWPTLYSFIVRDQPLDWIRQWVDTGALFVGAGREELLRYSPLATAFANPSTVGEITAGIPKRRLVPILRNLPRTVRLSRGRSTQHAIFAAAKTLGISTERSRLDIRQAGLSKLRRLGAEVSTELTGRGLYAPRVDNLIQGLRTRKEPIEIAELAKTISRTARRIDLLGPGAARTTLSDALSEISEMGTNLKFEYHESEGMLPLASKVTGARVLLQRLRGQKAPVTSGVRHVNAAFMTEDEAGDLKQLPQKSARLRPGKLVHLGIRIGDKDASLITAGSTALVEEILRSPEGAEIEIGVTSIDFDLVGDAVQQVWLPPSEPTELVTFAVIPRAKTTVPGVARLRISLFRENNVVQSFLMAAGLEHAAGELQAALGRALGIEAGEIARLGEVGYLVRLEYSVTGIDHAGASEPRALTIIANQSAGEKIVTIKGEELFTVTSDPNLPAAVQRTRDALSRASVDDRKLYRYMYQQQPNAGDPATLCDALWDVAREGWGIFDLLVPGEPEQARVRELLQSSGGVHAAHIDVSSVIPWALLYDRKVYDRKSMHYPPGPGTPVYEVERALCTRSMPAADGSMPNVECGKTAGCLLHPSENERRAKNHRKLVCEDTVICPRRFWGFTVPIEVPAQQVSGVPGKQPPALKSQIAASHPISIVAGFNPNLEFAKTHESKLEDIAENGGASLKPADSGRRDQLLDLLNFEEPDVVYFFCHGIATITSDAGRTLGPSLDLGLGHKGGKGAADDVLEASDFAGKDWTHAPLVLMNGCGTVGFSPYAPSTFIKQFIQGRKAAAVIGTEVTVWEVLATEFATAFLENFLGDKPSGEALLRARRALLSKHNPLGLVYTLYGSSSLSIAKRS
jgi:hypothetical protein